MNAIAFFPMLIILLVVVIPLLVLFIRLCIKKPKVAAIIAVVPLLLILTLFWFVPVRRAVHTANSEINQIPQYQDTSSQSVIVNNGSTNQSPIWSEGIDDQFDADVYPSKESAARSVAKKLDKESLNLSIDLEQIESIIIYRGSSEAELVEILRDTILNLYPGIKCRIDETGGLPENNEIGMSLNVTKGSKKYVDGVFLSESYSFQATISYQMRSRVINIDYVEKPWVENFSSFVNSQPDKHYIVAKSRETCQSPEQANQQSINDAWTQILPLIHNKIKNELSFNRSLTFSPDDIPGGMIVDKFVQGFDGSVSKIWRQATLLDVSPEKLNLLANSIVTRRRVMQETTWKTIFSIAGLFVLITIVYAFLNAATRGYYSWSLRIIGVILAAIFLIIILNLA